MTLGPRNRYDRPKPQANEYQDQIERDRAIEDRWQYERDGTMSTLAYVSAFRVPLVAEFMDWYSRGQEPGLSKSDAVAQWEVVKFGKVLDRATHGILTYAVLDAFYPERHGKKWEPKPKPPIKAPSSVAGMVKKLTHSMPGLNLGHKAIDARLMELERQRKKIEGEE